MSRATRIRSRLEQAFEIEHLEVTDESDMHSVPEGAESHFKLLVVSDGFDGLPLVKRHRTINALMKDEFDAGLHALAIHAWTPAEWFDKGGAAPASPQCLGGSRSDGAVSPRNTEGA